MLIQCSVYCAILITSAEAILDLLLKVSRDVAKENEEQVVGAEGIEGCWEGFVGKES